MRHRGGGTKKLKELVDYQRASYPLGESLIKVLGLWKSQNKYLACVIGKEQIIHWVPAWEGIKKGQIRMASRNPQIVPKEKGSAYPLKFHEIGNKVHNIERKVGQGGEISRSTGNSWTVLYKEKDSVWIKKDNRLLELNIMNLATVGRGFGKREKRWKAGTQRKLGIRPTVRGHAMNICDHPNGGETKGGRLPRTKWGKLVK